MLLSFEEKLEKSLLLQKELLNIDSNFIRIKNSITSSLIYKFFTTNANYVGTIEGLVRFTHNANAYWIYENDVVFDCRTDIQELGLEVYRYSHKRGDGLFPIKSFGGRIYYMDSINERLGTNFPKLYRDWTDDDKLSFKMMI